MAIADRNQMLRDWDLANGDIGGGYAGLPQPNSPRRISKSSLYQEAFGRAETLHDLLAIDRKYALPTLDELNDPLSMHNCTTAHAASIWTARFGTGWVSEQETSAALREDYRFWVKLTQRLYRDKVLHSADYEGNEHVLTAWRVEVPEDGNN